MGWDRRVLPRDRDKNETFPWMGLVAFVIIIGISVLSFWLVAVVFAGSDPADLEQTLLDVLQL